MNTSIANAGQSVVRLNRVLGELGSVENQGLSQNVIVGIRIRPLNANERKSGEAKVWIRKENGVAAEIVEMDADGSEGKAANFDYVFDESYSTRDVYDAMTQNILAGVLQGTIFAYGQTASGKTHTLMGSETEPGLTVLAVQDIFQSIEKMEGYEFLIRASYIEIYNEEIEDLLYKGEGKKKYTIVDDKFRGPVIKGINEVVVVDSLQVLDLIASGEKNRHFGSTNMNLHSSRSHTLFKMMFESRRTVDAGHSPKGSSPIIDYSTPLDSPMTKSIVKAWDGNKDAVRMATLNLVDLAGSERVAKTMATGAQLKEGTMINKSLLTLGSVISQLSNAKSKSSTGHIPYRDSKLTRLLSASLGGNARTAMISAISPAESNRSETKSTLMFAARAQRIVNNVSANVVANSNSQISQYKLEIENLKLQLANDEGREKYNAMYEQKAKKVEEDFARFQTMTLHAAKLTHTDKKTAKKMQKNLLDVSTGRRRLDSVVCENESLVNSTLNAGGRTRRTSTKADVAESTTLDALRAGALHDEEFSDEYEFESESSSAALSSDDSSDSDENDNFDNDIATNKAAKASKKSRKRVMRKSQNKLAQESIGMLIEDSQSRTMHMKRIVEHKNEILFTKTSEIESLQSTIIEMQQRIGELSDQNDSYANRVIKYEKDAEQLNCTISKHEQTIKSSLEKISSYEKEQLRIQENFDAQTEQLSTLHKQYESCLYKEKTTANTLHEREMVIQSLNMKISDSESRTAELIVVDEKAQTSLKNYISTLQESLTMSDCDLQTTKQNLKLRNLNVKTLETKLNKMDTQNVKMEENLLHSISQIEKLSSQVEAYKVAANTTEIQGQQAMEQQQIVLEDVRAEVKKATIAKGESLVLLEKVKASLQASQDQVTHLQESRDIALKEVESLKASHEALNSKTEKSSVSLAKAQEKCETNLRELSMMEDLLHTEKSSAQSSRAKCKDLEAELLVVNKQLEKYTQEISEFRQSFDKTRKAERTTSGLLQTTTSERDSLQNQLHAVTKSLQEVEQTSALQSDELSAATSNLGKFKLECQRLCNENDRILDAMNTLQLQESQISSDYYELKNKHSITSEDLSVSQNLLQTSQKQQEMQRRLLQDLEHSLVVANHEKDSSRNELDELRTTVVELKSKVATQQRTNGELERNNDELSLELEDLRDKIVRLQQREDILCEEIGSMKNIQPSITSREVADVAKLRAELVILQRQEKHNAAELSAARHSVASLKQEHYNMLIQKDQAVASLAALETQFSSQKAVLRESKQHLETFKSEKHGLERDVNYLTLMTEQLRSQSTEVVTRAKEQNQCHLSTIQSEYQQRIEKLNATNLRLNDALEKHRSENNELDALLSSSKKAYHELERRYNFKVSEMEQLEIYQTQCESTSELLKEKLSRFEDESEQVAENLSVELAAAVKALNSSKIAEERCTKKLKNATEEISRLQVDSDNLVSMKQKVQSLAAEYEAFKEKVRYEQDSLEILKQEREFAAQEKSSDELHFRLKCQELSAELNTSMQALYELQQAENRWQDEKHQLVLDLKQHEMDKINQQNEVKNVRNNNLKLERTILEERKANESIEDKVATMMQKIKILNQKLESERQKRIYVEQELENSHLLLKDTSKQDEERLEAERESENRAAHVHHLNQLMADMSNEIASFTTYFPANSFDLSSLPPKQDIAGSKNSRSTDELDELEAKCTNIQRLLQETKLQLSESLRDKQDLERMVHTWKRKHENKMDDESFKSKTIIPMLNDMLESSHLEMEELCVERTKLQQQLLSLQALNENLRQALDVEREMVIQKTEAEQAIQEQCMLLKEEGKKHVCIVENFKKDMRQLRIHENELEQEKSNLEEKLQTEQKLLNSKVDDLRNKATSLQKLVNELNVQLGIADGQIETARDLVQQAQHETQLQKSSCRKLEDDIATLENEKEKMEVQHLINRNELCKSTEKLKVAEQRLEILQAQLASMKVGSKMNSQSSDFDEAPGLLLRFQQLQEELRNAKSTFEVQTKERVRTLESQLVVEKYEKQKLRRKLGRSSSSTFSKPEKFDFLARQQNLGVDMDIIYPIRQFSGI